MVDPVGVIAAQRLQVHIECPQSVDVFHDFHGVVFVQRNSILLPVLQSHRPVAPQGDFVDLDVRVLLADVVQVRQFFPYAAVAVVVVNRGYRDRGISIVVEDAEQLQVRITFGVRNWRIKLSSLKFAIA